MGNLKPHTPFSSVELKLFWEIQKGLAALVCSVLAWLAARYKAVISAGGVGCVMPLFAINELHPVKYRIRQQSPKNSEKLPLVEGETLLRAEAGPPPAAAKGSGGSISESCSTAVRTFSQVRGGGSLRYVPAAHTHHPGTLSPRLGFAGI